jgi:hypothetical protein
MYHQDYNDTITAINNLTPQKELFNLGFLPVKNEQPHNTIVDELTKLFIEKINNDIEKNVQEYLHTNSGWNDMGKRRREKTGAEEQLEDLGLPGSLYNQPASKNKLTLIGIQQSEMSKTDDQIRIAITMVVQKQNVKDQMVLKIYFFMEREDMSNDRDDRETFFTKNIDDDNLLNDKNVIIEQIFVVGYLSDDGKPRRQSDNFHNYGNVQRMDGTIDQEQVIKIMLEKHKEREKELNTFLCSVDDETKQIHDVPGIDSYSVYKNTRTIMDDLAKFPHKSFGEISI